MKNLIKITIGLMISIQALAVEGVYINETALELEAQYRKIANTMAVSYLEHGACSETEIYQSEIVQAAKKSRQYHDSNYEFNENTGDLFTLTQPTLDAIKTTFALKEIMNMVDHSDPRTIESALNRVVMWGPAPGAYGHISKLVFGENLNVTFYTKKLLDESPWVRWQETPGDFYVETNGAGQIIIRLGGTDSNGYDSYELYFSWEYEEWMMRPLGVGGANPFFDGYTDFPDECSA